MCVLVREPTVAHVEAAYPEDDVFGNIRSVIGKPFQIAAGEDELQILGDIAGRLLHAVEEPLENFIALVVHQVIAFQYLTG